MKRKPNWKREGMKSNGLYHNPKKVLTDVPQLGESQIEVLKDYITKYTVEKGKAPAYTHLNKRFGYNATKQFYTGLTK